MTPDVVVDVGNTRIKWGLCRPTVADGYSVTLPPDPLDWAEQVESDGTPAGALWVVAGVNPSRVAALTAWIRSVGGTCVVLETHTELPIVVDVDEPGAVGLDRLLGVVAARAMVPPNTPAITIDIGTAMTVNVVDERGAFRGGAILPGPRLMGLALCEYTAKLPFVPVSTLARPDPPGRNTSDAIRAGITAALVGGAERLYTLLAPRFTTRPWVILTGGGLGDPDVFRFPGAGKVVVCPYLNLEGIRIAAEALP